MSGVDSRINPSHAARWLPYLEANGFNFVEYRRQWVNWCARGKPQPVPPELLEMAKRRNELVTRFLKGGGFR